MLKPRAVRSNALAKLAQLSTISPAHTDADLSRLCDAALPATRNSRGANNSKAQAQSITLSKDASMSYREFDTLLALCSAAPSVRDQDCATHLLEKLQPYLIQACYNPISPSPFLRDLDPSPWELLTNALTNAILSLALNYPHLRTRAASSVQAYVQHCTRLAAQLAINSDVTRIQTDEESLAIILLATSIIGFLHGAADNVHFWSPSEQLELLLSMQAILSDGMLLNTGAACSKIRSAANSHVVNDFKLHISRYLISGRPLGAMLLRQSFSKYVEACASLFVTPLSTAPNKLVLATLLAQDFHETPQVQDPALVQTVADIASQEIVNLDEGHDFLQLATPWQQKKAHLLRASCMLTYLCCTLVSDDAADPGVLVSWLETTLSDPAQTADEDLASTALRIWAVLAKRSPVFASELPGVLPRLFIRESLKPEIAEIAAECLVVALRAVSQDTVITTLYGLGNLLSASRTTDGLPGNILFSENNLDGVNFSKPNGDAGLGSTVSLAFNDATKLLNSHANIALAIVAIAKGLGDPKITALALSMLIQKVGKVNAALDLNIIIKTAVLAAEAQTPEFRALLRLYNRLSQESIAKSNGAVTTAIADAMEYLSRTLKGGTVLYDIYLHHLLETIISQGDAQQLKPGQKADVESATQELAFLLKPLSLLVESNVATEGIEDVESFATMQRDAWYNFVVHGFVSNSPLWEQHLQHLRILARYSHPLTSEGTADRLESDIDLNIVLRRGMAGKTATLQRKAILQALPRCESDIRSLSYPEIIFLQTVHMVESLRANAGDCTQITAYFVDPQLQGGAMGNCMASIAIHAVDNFLQATLLGGQELSSAPFVAQQLATLFESCCHRVERVQQVAYSCVERIIARIPSALCQRVSVFALLDLLTIMWTSCLEAETEEYEWRSVYTSPNGATTVQLSDDYNFRKVTLRNFHKQAREWIIKALNTAGLDVKGLLQTYLSDFGDDETLGHVSLGRSFASKMGAFIPQTDQRLGAIEVENDLDIDAASDFIAQYTTRQEYRYKDPSIPDDITLFGRNEHADVASQNANSSGNLSMTEALTQIEQRILRKQKTSLNELRELLRSAAALLCRSHGQDSTILALFVRIPFRLFTKQTIKLGLSLCMGVIKENPRLESRVLVEIVENWIWTVHAKLGLFSHRASHVDPFFIQEEFAPSDNDGILKQQQRMHDQFAPHFRIVQFLASHYQATRLSSSSTERAYLRLLKATLSALRRTKSHPLAREIHFQIVLLGLKVLMSSTTLNRVSRWRLKDDLLSAALAWFAQPPRWSFGGNRLQIKAETHILADVAVAFHDLSEIGQEVTSSRKSLHHKHTLLQLLLADEQNRLNVWLYPMEHDKRHYFALGQQGRAPSEESVLMTLDIAWKESPAIATQLATRFRFTRLSNSVRALLLNHTREAINEPDALELLMGPSLPKDIGSQLKYLMYWAPVNPITAVTYFLPSYGNHPSIIQYAVRALESHSVDVTFFYVPQIVQTLRYDVLGYIERYIIETAKFSQLFAHQIIWNMKANAFKDEDSQIPDSVKPTLDKVTDSLISSFSSSDKAFYEREFAFFNEITGISGKLRPFIKRPKPEKKQKIEEELRQIQLEVGVYLPSNPDGVVVGIDRKSGKPLQSHAKAPYMATFRIRKEHKGDNMQEAEQQLENINTSGDAHDDSGNTFEIWQSAIFKVGDDCRQDVLALQMIAAFRGIFHNVGLPVYVFPYRVTATAPGCGVIDVLPNSISRDMLGREAVNGLYEWFVSRFGRDDSPDFQRARNNFIKSLAAYSIISYLLQFKDRHNGNIMFDDEGHILHIDFGFCFDIVPGGVRFERAPFKLTKEMVAVMGGDINTQSFRWFEELCVKAFLASRQYVRTLSHIIECMLDSGLPCFKPETMQHFRERFVLDKSEREAAEFVRFLVRKSYAHYSTKVYDEFQLLTNGIPF